MGPVIDESMRLIDYFARGADLFPDRHCLQDGTRRWTYRGQSPRVASLPRSPVGKVLKKTLREPCWASRERKI
jgi:hypothetical protein